MNYESEAGNKSVEHIQPLELSSSRKYSECRDDEFLITKSKGWKGLSSLEKSLSIALGLVSVLAFALMIAVIVVGVKLNKDDYKPPEKLTEPTPYPPWITTISTSTTLRPEVTTRERPTWPPSTTPSSRTPWCETGQCWYIQATMDKKVNPCDNFYDYACGEWMRQNPPSVDQPIVNQFMKLEESFQFHMKHILEKDASESAISPLWEAENLAKTFYETCMNDTDQKNETFAGLKELIGNITEGIDAENLTGILAKAKIMVDADYLVKLWVNVGLQNNSRNAIFIDLPDTEILEDLRDGNYTERLKLYKTFMKKIWSKVFSDEGEETINGIVQFEEKLWDVTNVLNQTEEGIPTLMITNLTALKSLNKDLYNFINFTLSEALNKENGTLWNERETECVILNPTKIGPIFNLFNEDYNKSLNYIKWKTLFDFAKHDNEAVRSLFNEKVLGLSTYESRSRMCVKQTTQFFGPFLVSEYVKGSFPDPEAIKSNVFNFTDSLRQTAKALTEKALWIASNTTRDVILQRLDDLEIYALFPFSLVEEDDPTLPEYFLELNLDNPESHFQNMVDLTKWFGKKHLQLIRQTPAEAMLLQELESQVYPEVHYVPNTNSLYLPTAAFQLPFYEPNGTFTAYGYGSIGTLISQHLLEVIEDTAISYQGAFPENAWDPETLSNYWNHTTECENGSVTHYEVPGLEVITEENKALRLNPKDIGGFKVALKSFFSAKELNEFYTGQAVGSEKYSSTQLFHLGFAQTWCEARLDENRVKGSQTAEAVNKVLESLKEFKFSEEWNCPRLMNQKVCSIW